MRLYLDDNRPCPVGWFPAATVDEAKQLIDRMLAGPGFDEASLDHDLGACVECCDVEDLRVLKLRDAGKVAFFWDGNTPNCEHVGTGYQLVLWMAEHGKWPKKKPLVHSMNAEGARRMRGVIDRYFGTKAGEPM